MPELLEVVLVQNYYGQQCINRFNYLADGTPAGVSFSFGLTVAIGMVTTTGAVTAGSLLEKIQAVQVQEVDYVQLTVLNPYDDVDFYSLPFGATESGARDESGLSPAMAIGFKSNQTTRAIRRGYKRIVGASETLSQPGGEIIVTQGGDVDLLAQALGQQLTYDDAGNTLTYDPVIVGKQAYTTDSGATAYKYNDDKVTQLANLASSITWTPYTTVRTQRSRQYGVGR